MTKLQKMPQNGLQKNTDSLNKFLRVTKEILIDYHRATLRQPLTDDDLTETVGVWAEHFITARIYHHMIWAVYRKALFKSDFVTVPVMLRTWKEMQESGINNTLITTKECELCHGKGVAINMNRETLQDEEVTCICRIGAK